MPLSRDLLLTRRLGGLDIPVNIRGMLLESDLFLVCGGPSLLAADLESLRRPGVQVLGVNNAFGVLRDGRSLRGRLWLSSDHPDRFLPSILADPTILKFARIDFANEPVSELGVPFHAIPNVLFWRAVAGHDSHPSLLDVGADSAIPWKHSSLFAALIVSLYLGVANVYLVGVDFGGDRTAFYAFDETRDERQWELNQILFDSLVGPLEVLREQAISVGVRIYNTSPASQLGVFPFRPLAECVAAATRRLGNLAQERTLGRYGKLD
jgi:hypothetical protein